VVTKLGRPPCPREGVLVQVEWAGICGSDLVVYSGAREQPGNPPGHEFSGTIIEVGEAVQDFVVGDRVCAESFSHCGACNFCQRGDYNLCVQRVYMPDTGPSGFSEIAAVPASALHRLPDAVDFELGALVEPLAVGLHALGRIVEAPVHRLLIIGAGTIGLSTLLCAKARGIKDVRIVAKYPHQADLARRFGANEVLEPHRYLRQGVDGQPDAIVSTSTSGEALSQAIRICRRRGTIVLTSAYTADTTVQLRSMVSEELYLAGAIAYAQSETGPDFDVIIAWLADGILQPRSLISHRFKLDDIAKAFRVAQDKSTGSVKVHIRMHG
jgi:2-desacetyl-2-hydroxyethyl bacteriochlorophyllide A dehydrogenase